MRKSILFTCLSVLFLFASAVFGVEVPALKGYVNDYAGLMTKEKAAKISRDLELYEGSTSNQIYILTVPDMQGDEIKGFSMKVAETWKAGRKGKDNGVIITFAKAEKKVRIEVGRGLEGVLTDLICGRIIREDIFPKFSKGDAASGLEAAIPHIILATKGEYKGDGSTSKSSSGKQNNEATGKIVASILIFLVVVCILSIFSNFLSTIGGGISAPSVAYCFFDIGTGAIVILAILGLIVGFLIYHLLRAATGSGSGDGFFDFGDGGFFGGDGSGGSFFSGGGGDFGGGGSDGGGDGGGGDGL